MSNTLTGLHPASASAWRYPLAFACSLGGALLLGAVFLAGLDGSAVSGLLALAREDGAVESLSALAYLAGFAACAWAALRGSLSVMTVCWAALCFLFLGEETSWFQRIFGYQVTSIEAVNAQGEFNLHNLSALTGIGWRDVDSLETFKRALLGSQNLFQMGFLAFFLVLPLASMLRFTQPLQRLVGYRRPGAVMLCVTWGLVALSYVLVAMGNGELHKDALVETRELVFAGAIFAYALLLARPDGNAGRRMAARH